MLQICRKDLGYYLHSLLCCQILECHLFYVQWKDVLNAIDIVKKI